MSYRVIEIKVTPGARIERLITEASIDGAVTYRAMVTAQPTDGNANQALLGLLAKHFNLKRREIEIVSGRTSRHKLVRIPSALPTQR